MGRVFVSVSGSDLYLRIDRDLTQLVGGYYAGYSIQIHGPGGYSVVGYTVPGPWNAGGHYAHGDLQALTPEYEWRYGQGIEIRFPMGSGGSGSWAEIRISVYSRVYLHDYRSERDKIYVKVR